MKKCFVAASIVAVSVSAPAFAQSASGPRVEATVGWDHVSINVDDESESKSGVTYGGELGYDLRLANGMLIGAYAGIDGSSTRDCISAGTERACIKAGRNITVGGRIGAQVGQRATVYAKGGYSNGRLEVDYSDSAFPSDNFSDHGDADGYHVGAGVEVGLSRGFYGKAEYVYTRYSTQDDNDFDTRLDRHRVLGGFGYRF